MAGGTAADLVARVGIDYGAFAVGMRNMRNETTGFTVYLKRFSGIIGAAFGTATLAIGYATKVATDFEYALVKLGNVTASSNKEITAFGKSAMDMGASFGFGATEVVKGMTYLGQAGFTTTEILSTMPTVLKMATVASMDLEEAANNLAIALRSFNMDVSRSGEVASTYAVVADATQTSIEGITTAMRYVSPIASAAGWSLKETAAAIGMMSQKGYDASIAGTALRGALTRILNPSKEAAASMKMLGYRFKDNNGNVKSSIELVKEFERVQMSAGTAAALFGDRASAAVIGLANTTVMVGNTLLKGSAALEYLNRKAAENTDYIDKSFAKYAETTKIKWDMMMSSIQNVGIELGGKILPYIKDFLSQDLSPWLKQLQDWVAGNGNVEQAVARVYSIFRSFAVYVKDFLENTGPQALKDFIGFLDDLRAMGALVYQGWTYISKAYKELMGHAEGKNVFLALAEDAGGLCGKLANVAAGFGTILGELAAFAGGGDITGGMLDKFGAQLGVDMWAEKIYTALDEVDKSWENWLKNAGWAGDWQTMWEVMVGNAKKEVQGYLTWLEENQTLNKMLRYAKNAFMPEALFPKKATPPPAPEPPKPKVWTPTQGSDRSPIWDDQIWNDIAALRKPNKAAAEYAAYTSQQFIENVDKQIVAARAKAAPINFLPKVDTAAPELSKEAKDAKNLEQRQQEAEAATKKLNAQLDTNVNNFNAAKDTMVGGLVIGNKDFVAAAASIGGALDTPAREWFALIQDGSKKSMDYILETANMSKEQLAQVMTLLAENSATSIEAFNNLLIAQTATFQSESMIWGETFMGFFGIVEQGLNQMVGSVLFGGQSIGKIFMDIGKQMVTSMVASFIKIQMQHFMSSMAQRVTEEATAKASMKLNAEKAKATTAGNISGVISGVAAWAAALSGPMAPAIGAAAGAATTAMCAPFLAIATGGGMGGGGGAANLGGGNMVGGADGGFTGGASKMDNSYSKAPMKMASGGIVTRPTSAIVGEAGPEAVIPLDQYNGGGGGGNTYIFHVLGSIDDAAAMKITEGVDRVVRTRDARLTATTANRATSVDGSLA